MIGNEEKAVTDDLHALSCSSPPRRPRRPAPRAPPAPPMRKARDPDIAVHQELCAAREARTVAAYDLFIARHPRHALAATARAERDALGATKHAQRK